MSSVPVYQNFINGRFTPSQAHIDVLNPATGALLSKVPASTADDVDQALAAARAAQKDWARKPAIERAGHLRRIAAKLRENVAHLARTITLEQGKVSGLAEVEVNFTADYLDYMAEWARRIEGEIITSDRPNENIFLFRKPLGVVAGILPWNFPFFLIARKLAPALLTGNTIVIKPSEETPNNCFEFAKLVAQTDLPAGVFNVVCGDGQVGAALTAHKGVDMISFTGSVATGSRIMAAAAPNITKLNLELGGKAPAIVCADFDVRTAAERILFVKYLNAGQICTSVDHAWLPEASIAAFVEHARQIMPTRYPRLDTPDYTSIIDEAAFERLLQALDEARQRGAQVIALLPGPPYDRATRKIAPHIVLDAPADSLLLTREIFGPILPLRGYTDLNTVIDSINAGPRPLAIYPFSNQAATVQLLIDTVMSGGVSVNDALYHVGQHDLPFGGVGESGMGHYHGVEGFHTFSKLRPVFYQARYSALKLLWPPYGKLASRVLNFLTR